jgi:hypothetical protein
MLMLCAAQQFTAAQAQHWTDLWYGMVAHHVLGLHDAFVLQGCVLEEYTQGVEQKLRTLELESIQDYIAESDNLVDLHQQVRHTAAAG